ncbi:MULTISPECIES: UDP-N-acetylmuramoyl-L-alanine--D-glutamate ligase [unclassified Acetobacterium]|jgi:UDP-N-acetylmuramoylalanine--D-glutamate ligase|uniref:UDP-N-acetylmuramoyl-L-alanine--D-glutamate ligase n=1 Tax=unclassified Acetobacterium TaxID=2638182 RepID=UPI000DBEC6DE|nr:MULTISPECIES: UDP-N-acetylmuramoyl-L-alanine--D-glutamate ligase [unclassified Acetobacterium]AWW27964.1 UDP-N-acetylmuramoyl-L-alanine--D-glutamate ligase [Acetobacterium sp. KB-1]MDZ5726487.1 UDP-N-acetylmuramoyl-L-alanine--D-glutamate ligase [Acetobacterium sp. K1/6]
MIKRTLVVGAARSGVAVTELLLSHGEAVLLTDTRSSGIVLKEFPQILDFEKNPEFESIFGVQPSLEILTVIDEVVISPGVPLSIPIIQAAYAQGIPVTGEVEAAYRLTQTPFIAITGTNGKTTTTTLLGEIFKASGRGTYVVGNIGDPITNYVDSATADEVFITEISSFQLETIHTFRPQAAAILNLTPDHLDRHLSMENYVHAKGRIFENQRVEDLLVLNGDDPLVGELGEKAVSRKALFSYKKTVDYGAWCLAGEIYINNGQESILVCREDELGIIGPHNTMNALAALTLAYFSGVELEVIVRVLKTFAGVEHRLELVGCFDGVTYINDSKGTNTNATITAVNAVTEPIILLAGGYDKKEDYSELMALVAKRVKQLIVLGVTADDLIKAATAKGFTTITKVDTYEEAVAHAKAVAVSGDTVLLSPACASWDMFDNYEIRGRVFKRLVTENQ